MNKRIAQEELIRKSLFLMKKKDVPSYIIEYTGVEGLYRSISPEILNFLFDDEVKILYVGKAKVKPTETGEELDFFKASSTFTYDELEQLQLVYYLYDEDLKERAPFVKRTLRELFEDFMGYRCMSLKWWNLDDCVAPNFFKKNRERMEDGGIDLYYVELVREFISEVENSYVLEEINFCNYTLHVVKLLDYDELG